MDKKKSVCVKYLTYIIFLINLIFINISFANKDYKFDAKTSTLIPNFAGTVLFQRGNAKIIKADGSFVKTRKGTKIYQHQEIKTASRSVIKLKLTDQTILTIAPNSRLKINKFVFRTQKDRDSIISLIKGKLRTHYRTRSKKDGQLQLRIGTVSMGVRGTKILANIYDGKPEIAITEGKVELTDHISHKIFSIKKGEYFYDNKQRHLSKRELAMLKTNKREDMDIFLPFLSIIHKSSIRIIKKTNTSKVKNPKGNSWKKSLEDLNNKLKRQNRY